MERKFLEDLGLEKEAIDKIMAENGNDINAQKKLTEAETGKLTTANDTIKGLQDAVKKFDGVDVEKLKGDITTLQTKYDTDLKQTKRDFSLENRLIKEGAVNTKAVKALLDLDKISLDGDNLIGLDEQLKPLKESEKWAFGTVQQPNPPAPVAGAPAQVDLSALPDDQYFAKAFETKK